MWRGAIVAGLSSLFFASMALFTKMLAEGTGGIHRVAAGEVVFFRFLIGAVIVLSVRAVKPIALAGKDRRGIFWRSAAGAAAILTFYLSIQLTSLTNATLLSYTYGIFGPLFAALWLRERISALGKAGIVSALAGAYFVIGMQFSHTTVARIGDLIGLLSGIAGGLTIVATRHLRRTESTTVIFFYLCLIGIPMALTSTAFQHFTLPDLWGFELLLAVGVFGVLAEMSLTYAFRYISASYGSVLTMITVVIAALYDVILLHNPVGWKSVIGISLVIMGALALSLEHRKSAVTPPDD